jgi:hypothetical protein
MNVDLDIDVDVDETDTKELKDMPQRSLACKTTRLGGGIFTPQLFVNQNLSIHSCNMKGQGNVNLSKNAPLDKDGQVNSHSINSSTTTPITLPTTPQPIPPISKNVKILILGNAKCGKSSLINRYCHGTFSEKYKTTIGADFIRKDIAYQNHNKDSAPVGVRLQVIR